LRAPATRLNRHPSPAAPQATPAGRSSGSAHALRAEACVLWLRAMAGALRQGAGGSPVDGSPPAGRRFGPTAAAPTRVRAISTRELLGRSGWWADLADFNAATLADWRRGSLAPS